MGWQSCHFHAPFVPTPNEVPWFSDLLDAERITGLQNVDRRNRLLENKNIYRKPIFLLSIVEFNSYTDKKTGGLLEHM